MYDLCYSCYDYFLRPKKSIIIDSFVGKENKNHNTHKENILALNLYCNILNSFVPKQFHTVRNESH